MARLGNCQACESEPNKRPRMVATRRDEPRLDATFELLAVKHSARKRNANKAPGFSPYLTGEFAFRSAASCQEKFAAPQKALRNQKVLGAGEGIRTLDPDLGKVVLYH
jgi:hypothetical protein